MTARVFATIGMLLCAWGAFLLFRYSLPFAVRTGGHAIRVTMPADPRALTKEKRAGVYGWLGFIMGIVGTALQIVGVWLT